MNYVETVADLFTKRSGRTLLPASDYVLIAEWEKEEIPLQIVLDCINLGFDTALAKLSKIDSIEHFENNILMEYANSIK